MIYVETEVKESNINGEGLFLLEPVKKGQIIALFAQDAEYMTEEKYQEEQRKNNELIIMSAVRYVGEYFLYNSEIGNEEYINHSSEPNMIYHCGICFAKKNLKVGEELTVDYKYFLAVNDVNKFIDIHNNKLVDGLPHQEALFQSTRELLDIINKSDQEEI